MIMFVLAIMTPDLGAVLEAFIDVTALALISTPAIYIWVVKPFVVARDEALLKLETMAFTDQLTDLPNRRYFTNYFKKLISESVRYKYYLGILLIDLDNFKPVNDDFGHDAGDTVLQEIARRLLSSVREGDLVVRMGGDEFIILLNHLGDTSAIASREAVTIAEKLQKVIANPVGYKSHDLKVGSSIGVRIIGRANNDIQQIIKEVDIAMYHAKKGGKGRVFLFNGQ